MSGMELPAVEIKIWDHIIIDTFATLLFRSDLRFAIEIPIVTNNVYLHWN